ncbi:MAG: hypothetical protein EOO07_11070, partial [Chitinophagaceae bacterium]
MKNILRILIALTLISFDVNAQFVGMQTRTPKASALLDLDVSNLADGSKKGFLMPRVSLTRTNLAAPVNTPKIGLWVFNTNTTTGANAVAGNNIYMWSGTAWEAYSSSSDIQVRLSPDDFFMKSSNDFLMSSTTLTSFNSSTLIPVPWEASSIVITNPTYVNLNADLETFKVNQTGFYEISGFINYNPKINSSSSKTGLRLVLQVNKNGSWTDRIAVNATIEEMATNTVQTVTIPFDIIKLDQNDAFRFMITKPDLGSNTNHSANAG